MKNPSDVFYLLGACRLRATDGLVVVEKQNPVSREWHILETFASVLDAVAYVQFIARE